MTPFKIKNILPAAIALMMFLYFQGVAFGSEKQGGSSKGSNDYYDSNILQSGSKPAGKHRKHKKNKKTVAAGQQNPGDSQEEVTDQKEVSEQADHPNSKNKK